MDKALKLPSDSLLDNNCYRDTTFRREAAEAYQTTVSVWEY